MRVAILGLGIIGSAWADNLRADGDTVTCWNRTSKGAPGEKPDPAAAILGAELIILVVADPPAVESVLTQLLPALRPGQILMQSSTVDAACNRACAQAIAPTGALFLEGPFTGSKPAALARQTVFYMGGDQAILERARPALSRLAKAILHIGPVGMAASLKLAMNVNIALVAQSLCESLRLARAGGISDAIYFEALKLNASKSGVVDLKESKLRAQDWSPQFSLKHMHKDLNLAVKDVSVRLPLLESVRTIYAAGMAAGWNEDDFIGLMRLMP